MHYRVPWGGVKGVGKTSYLGVMLGKIITKLTWKMVRVLNVESTISGLGEAAIITLFF